MQVIKTSLLQKNCEIHNKLSETNYTLVPTFQVGMQTDAIQDSLYRKSNHRRTES